METVALRAHILVLDLSQKCWMNVEVLLPENQWLINQSGILVALFFSYKQVPYLAPLGGRCFCFFCQMPFEQSYTSGLSPRKLSIKVL